MSDSKKWLDEQEEKEETQIVKRNRPKSKITTTITKEVEFELSEAEAMAALTEYLVRMYPEFRNMNIKLDFVGVYTNYMFSHVKVSAKRETTKEE